MMTRRIQPWRRRVHVLAVVLFAGTPFVRIGGESALRFDVPSLELHFFGTSVAMDEFYAVLLGVLFLVFSFFWVTMVFGRIWCGWICPQTLLTEIGGSGRTAGDGLLRGLSRGLGQAALSTVLAGALVWYFVPPFEFLSRLASWRLHPVPFWGWIILSAAIWIDLRWVGYDFCTTVCPYSRLQEALFDRHTMVIAFDEKRRGDCLECTACLKACPVGVDIRQGLQASCVNCAECIDACRRIMEKRRGEPLVRYAYGSPGNPPRPWRPAAVAFLTATGAFLFLFILLLATRPELTADLRPLRGMDPRLSREGRYVRTFELTVQNRDVKGKTLSLRGDGEDRDVRLSPPSLEVPGGGLARIPLTVSTDASGRIDIIIEDGAGGISRLQASMGTGSKR